MTKNIYTIRPMSGSLYLYIKMSDKENFDYCFTQQINNREAIESIILENQNFHNNDSCDSRS